MKLRVLENFAGIGTQRMALENLGIDQEVVGITEIDKFAIKSYEAIHGKVNNLGDISLVDPNDVPDHDLFTYSFPCQDISIAGKQKGFEKGGETRSGLLWECEKVICAKKPKYLLMENVKNLVSKKFKPGFEEWLTALEDMGYTNYWQVLNAKDYGIPQNRERVFCVSILGEHDPYEFPEKETLELRLKDILEDEVDEKFYLDNDKAKQLIATVSDKYDIKETTPTDGGLKEPKAERIAGIFDKDGKRHQAGAVWDKEQLAPTLDTMKGGWRQPSVLIKNNTKQGYIEATDGDGVDLAFPSSNTRRGRVQKDLAQTLDTSDSKGVVVTNKQEDNVTVDRECMEEVQEKMMLTDDLLEYGTLKQYLFDKFGASRVCSRCNSQVLISDLPNYDYLCFECDENMYEFETKETHFLIGSTQSNAGVTDGDYSTTLTSAMGSGGGHVPMHNITSDLRIRKLTPKECWRLMGISDDDFEKAQEVNSNTQLYKQAGNAIVVDVLEAIFANLFK